jgi:hypothetical protein
MTQCINLLNVTRIRAQAWVLVVCCLMPGVSVAQAPAPTTPLGGSVTSAPSVANSQSTATPSPNDVKPLADTPVTVKARRDPALDSWWVRGQELFDGAGTAEERERFIQANYPVLAKYPPKSIKSVDAANDALQLMVPARQKADIAKKDGEFACYKQYLAQRCLNGVRRLHRETREDLRELEIEAEEFKRRDAEAKRVEKRGNNETQAIATGAQKQEKRERNQSDYDKKIGRAEAKREREVADEASREQRGIDNRADAKKKADERARKDREFAQQAPDRARSAREQQEEIDNALKRRQEKAAKLQEKYDKRVADAARPRVSVAEAPPKPLPQRPPPLTEADTVPPKPL